MLASWAKSSPSWLAWLMVILQRGGLDEDSGWLNARIESRDIVSKSGKLWFDTIGSRIDGLTSLIRAMGYSGVVYLLDELETVATLLSSIRQRLLSYEFLNLLVDSRRHVHSCFVFAATPDFGHKIRLDRPYSARYEGEYSDACRFMEKWNTVALDRIQLGPLTRADLMKLCQAQKECHAKAFEWQVGERFGDEFIRRFVSETERFGFGPREVARSFIHLLELAEQYQADGFEAGLPFAGR
jgi:hypothetical protein